MTTLTGGALVLAAGQIHAQYTPPPPLKPSPGYLNQYLRQEDPAMLAWDVSGSLRLRYEMKENGGNVAGVLSPAAPSGADFRKNVYSAPAADNDNDFFMHKLRMRVGYSTEWWNTLTEIRSSGTTGDDRGPGAGPESDGIAELHQAYLSLGNYKNFPLSLKVGRQELSYANERIIGAFAWNNVGRVFDAAKVGWQNSWFTADFFSSRVVVPDDNNFNMPNDYDWFSGIYGSTKAIPKNTTEFFLLSRNASAQAATANGAATLAPYNVSARDIYTIGARFKSNPGEFGNWDYLAELMGQFGHFNDNRAGVPFPSQEHQAYAIVLQGGYTFAKSWATPRVALEYAHASGDGNPNDQKHTTFENLFPTNHKFYGYMDFISLQNVHDVRPMITLKPHPRLSVALEGHAFWLASTRDSFYNVGGVPRGGIGTTPGTGYGINPSYSNYLGSEVDLIAGYALNKSTALEAGYGHFFRGDYLKQSFAAPSHGSTDADYVYLQATITF